MSAVTKYQKQSAAIEDLRNAAAKEIADIALDAGLHEIPIKQLREHLKALGSASEENRRKALEALTGKPSILKAAPES